MPREADEFKYFDFFEHLFKVYQKMWHFFKIIC